MLVIKTVCKQMLKKKQAYTPMSREGKISNKNC
jgi:hypothetical protein